MKRGGEKGESEIVRSGIVEMDGWASGRMGDMNFT